MKSPRQIIVLTIAILSLSLATSANAQDTVELLSGAKVSGKITERTADTISVQVTIGNRSLARKYPLSGVLAVTIDGKREVLNAAAGKPTTTATPGGKLAAGDTKSKAEVEALIEEVGRQQPDWYESTQLRYPQTLEMNWPKPKSGEGWNNQKQIGQYLWDIINTNPSRWREGVRFMHHVLTINQNDAEVKERAVLALARMYHNLLQDYGRSAFWLRAAGVDKQPEEFTRSAVTLAECYWKLGSKSMAVALLNRTPVTLDAAKLWGDMGETDKALAIAEPIARTQNPAILAYLVAGDACRTGGRSTQAERFYQQVLDAKPTDSRQQNFFNRVQGRARASLEAIKLFDSLNLARIADGSYQASSLGYEGQVQIEAVVRSGRIESVKVTQHREKQFYSSLTDTPAKIIDKQSVKGIDATSGATITSEAIINATAKALAKGNQ